MQFEILILGSADDVRPPSMTNQGAAFDLPIACPAWITKPPAGEIPAIEESDRLAPLPETCPLQGWRSPANPRPGSSAGASQSAHKLATHNLPFKLRVFIKTLFPFRREEFNLAFFHLDSRRWRRMIREPCHEDFWLVLLLRNLDPGREFLFGSFQGQIPPAQQRLEGGLRPES